MSLTKMPPPTRENIERHHRQIADDRRGVRPDAPLNARQREQIREAIHDHKKLTEK